MQPTHHAHPCLLVHSILAAVALLLSVGAAPAQDFQAGELYAKLQIGAIGGHGAVARIDAATGTVTEIVTIPQGDFVHSNGSLAWCPVRGRLVTFYRPNSLTPFGLYSVDSTGAVNLLAVTGSGGTSLAPRGDGKVYFLGGSSASPVRYLDVDNTVKIVTAAATGLPYVPSHPWQLNTEGLTYDPITNFLLFATRGNVNTGCSSQFVQMALHKVPLTPDGSQVSGAVTCKDFTGLSFSGVPDPRGWGRLPDGRILLVIAGLSTGNPPESTCLAIDPGTLAHSTFATPSFAALHTISAGTWSEATQKVVLMDSANDRLRFYAPGSTGNGSPSLALSVDLGAFDDCLVEIPLTSLPCSNALASYGTGTPGCQGIQTVGANTCPKIGTPSFHLTCDNAPASSLGLGIVTDALDFAGSDPFAIGVLLHAGFVGATELLTLDFTSDASGFGVAPAPIPAIPALVGRTFYGIALWAWSSCSLPPLGLSSSRGLAITIGS